jgi:HSP20 family protein
LQQPLDVIEYTSEKSDISSRKGGAMNEHRKEVVRGFLGMGREMDRFLTDVLRSMHVSSFAGGHSWSPPVDVFETENSYVVKMEVAGLELDDLNVTFEDGYLSISGAREDCCADPKISCHQMEIPYGQFKRTMFISRNVDWDGITAGYVGGFLEIRLPKAGEGRHKKVKIQVE